MSASPVTPRAQKVIERAKALGLAAEHHVPMVRVEGKPMIVSHAEAFLDGYVTGKASATRKPLGGLDNFGGNSDDP